MSTISFTKVDLPYGWLGNMSRHRVKYDEMWWETTEALFQALRFDDQAIREEIRKAKSPMTAKMKAKSKQHRALRRIEPASPADLENMRLVLRLKLKYHPKWKEMLLATGDAVIIEDCSVRSASPWGCQKKDGEWVGENLLGKLWMELRDQLRRDVAENSRPRAAILSLESSRIWDRRADCHESFLRRRSNPDRR